MHFVRALEAYIANNKNNDDNIEQKIRPAFNLIRFLLLDTKQIAETTLLTCDEARSIVRCLSQHDNLVGMPTGFSVNRYLRKMCGGVEAYEDFDCFGLKLDPSDRGSIYSCQAQI